MYRYDDFILVVSTWVQQSKSVRTRGSKLRRKTSLQNCQILENLLENIKIFPSRNPIFLARNPIFLNGFPTLSTAFLLSSTAFRFLQWLSDFPQWLSAFQEIWENLSTVASIQKITIWASYFLPLAPWALWFPLQCLHLPNKLDLDQAENLNLVENLLYVLMKLPSTVDGCTIVMKQCSLKFTCHRRWSWTFLCSHGMIMREIQDSHFWSKFCQQTQCISSKYKTQ